MKIITKFIENNSCFKANVNRISQKYIDFQENGPQGGLLHSVGCAQSKADVFYNSWNKEGKDTAVHAVIDAETGDTNQFMPWSYRGWHAGGSANDTHLGVEMCESKYIKYLVPGDEGYAPAKFKILDLEKARADCQRTYNSAVELFAMLAEMYKWNVDTDILSHKEAGKKGIATRHVDPEHFWTGLGMPYTMNGFRADVKAKIAENNKPKYIYRIQVGAYSKKKYAEDMLKKVQQHYPKAFIKKEEKK